MPIACFGLSCGSNPAATTPGGIHVAGTYTITRAYISNTCNPEIPGATATVAGVVTHDPGATRFTLSNSDGGNFDAVLNPDGSFSSGTQHRTGANGRPYDLLFEGRFSQMGFRATVSADLLPPNTPCKSVLDWQAVKQGDPNVIPGT